MAEYEIVFQIRRAEDFGSEPGEEIGFGASGAWSDLEAAVHSLASMVTNGEWETEGGRPKPEDVIDAIRQEAGR